MRVYFSAYLAAMCIIAATSCTTQDFDTPKADYYEGQELVFTARSGDFETKSALQSNETSIWWSRDDEICIYYGSSSSGSSFVASNDEDEFSYAYFTGQLTAFTGVNGQGVPNYFWAVYPFESAVGCDGLSVDLALPTKQMAKAGSFANNTNISIAKSLGLDLYFYNACSWFRFSVTKPGIKSVEFYGNNDEPVAGEFTVSMGEDGKPTKPEVTAGETVITLNAPEGESLEVGQMYYITLLPGVFENGFTMTLYTDNEVGSRSVDSFLEFERSIYITGRNFDRDIEYVSIVPPVRSYIYYTTSDNQAVDPYNYYNFDVPILSNEYSNGQGTITFDGELTTIGDRAFFRRSTLKTITFPETLTTIGDRAFFGSGLTSVTIPASVKVISTSVFGYCDNLSSITVASGNPVYDSRNGCNAIIHSDKHDLIAGCKNTIIPETVTSLSAFSFQGLSGLSQINIPASVTSLGERVFFHCTNLAIVSFKSTTPPEGGDGLFAECYKLEDSGQRGYIYVPSSNNNIESRKIINAYKEKASLWMFVSDKVNASNN